MDLTRKKKGCGNNAVPCLSNKLQIETFGDAAAGSKRKRKEPEIGDPKYPWHTIHLRTPKQARSIALIRIPRKTFAEPAWLSDSPEIDTCDLMEEPDGALVHQCDASQDAAERDPGYIPGARSIDDDDMHMGNSSQSHPLFADLPFSETELMDMLSQFLCHHQITRQTMTPDYVALFKVAVQHAAHTKLMLCKASAN